MRLGLMPMLVATLASWSIGRAKMLSVFAILWFGIIAVNSGAAEQQIWLDCTGTETHDDKVTEQRFFLIVDIGKNTCQQAKDDRQFKAITGEVFVLDDKVSVHKLIKGSDGGVSGPKFELNRRTLIYGDDRFFRPNAST